MNLNVKTEPPAVTFAHDGLPTPAAKLTTPSKSPTSITCSSTGPEDVSDFGPA